MLLMSLVGAGAEYSYVNSMWVQGGYRLQSLNKNRVCSVGQVEPVKISILPNQKRISERTTPPQSLLF